MLTYSDKLCSVVVTTAVRCQAEPGLQWTTHTHDMCTDGAACSLILVRAYIKTEGLSLARLGGASISLAGQTSLVPRRRKDERALSTFLRRGTRLGPDSHTQSCSARVSLARPARETRLASRGIDPTEPRLLSSES